MAHDPVVNPSRSVCAIVVTYNGGAIVRESLSAIAPQVDHVVIVDNGSDEQTLKVIREFGQRPGGASIIINDSNKGLGFALNQGVRFALEREFDWVLTLDQDSKAGPEMVRQMLDLYDRQADKESIAVIGPRSIFMRNGAHGDQQPVDKLPEVCEVDLLHTSGNMVRSSAFRTVGLFREEFFIDQIDYDFCFRLKRSGLKVVVAGDVTMNHRPGDLRTVRFLHRRVCCSNYSAERRYYIARNGVVLTRETGQWWFTRRHWALLFKESVKVLLYESDKTGKLILTIKGIKDGLMGISGPIQAPRVQP
jgi:rhamnosyltransferase